VCSSDLVQAGLVVSQDPAPKAKADQGSTVKLVVSTGVEQVNVPNVVGFTQADAQAALTASGLRYRVTPVDNATTDPGNVAAQNPAAGVKVAKDTEVELQVSKGTGEELVPDVSGQSLPAAQAALQAAGFRIGGPKPQASNTVPSGRVIGTDPAAGTSLKKNAVVTVIVSSGVEQVKVPGVVGQTENNATAALRNKGFDVSVVTRTVPAGDGNVGRVITQNPASGATADTASTVTITVGVAATTTTTTTPTTSSTP
jgi:beta-lactam-binding protein with PASTA domain